ncbi:MAG: putative oxidoreductase [Thiomicrorhabdus sp.]|nr:MAG: putative oxidoreductase [Thiomicrorhabdus sp.]
MQLLIKAQKLLDQTHHLSFLGAFALRLYLAPIFWIAGTNKLSAFEDTAAWFGNSEWGLGLPFPEVLATLAISAEIGGAILLVLGVATRLATIPLMVTMLVAAFSVHWNNGWQAVHDLMSPWVGANAPEALERLSKAKEILQTHGNFDWLTEHGSLIVSNNGIEWAATYFIMLLALFFIGGGKFVSIDYWIRRRFMPNA